MVESLELIADPIVSNGVNINVRSASGSFRHQRRLLTRSTENEDVDDNLAFIFFVIFLALALLCCLLAFCFWRFVWCSWFAVSQQTHRRSSSEDSYSVSGR